MSKLYIYVVARDFGFAPNPFHGVCTLATCKPKIRSVAQEGDWILGVGGGALRATGRCIYFMQVTGALSFNEYWNNPEFASKRPVRNGSRKMMLGDNIYHRVSDDQPWSQENSHHSQPDGSPDPSNVANDTGTDRILYSKRFVYFGRDAREIPKAALEEINYRNARHHRVFADRDCPSLLAWIEKQGAGNWNTVLADPFQFHQSGARYSKKVDRLVWPKAD